MAERGVVMDAACQKFEGSREVRGDVRSINTRHSECLTLHMHLMKRQFYLLITHLAPSHSTQRAKPRWLPR